MLSLLEKNVAYIEGVGPLRAKILEESFRIVIYEDLLSHFPFRYEDRTKWYRVAEIHEGLPYVQTKGVLGPFKVLRRGKKNIVTASFTDESGTISLVWFHAIHWVRTTFLPGNTYYLLGKPSTYQARLGIVHPQLTPSRVAPNASSMEPVYLTTAKLKKVGLDSRGMANLQKKLIDDYRGKIEENLPPNLVQEHNLLARDAAFAAMHFPEESKRQKRAAYRFKFEEVFFLQLRIQHNVPTLKKASAALRFPSTSLVKTFYQTLPFPLTEAQKRVIKEIRQDLTSGRQMNRLLQGDVGSGKTLVAFISMLFPLAEKVQVAFMAPTEVLAYQHYRNLQAYTQDLNLPIALLTGSTTRKERKRIAEALAAGEILILVGTHALLEASVQFRLLGLVVIDEQHRFGVAQRAKLWDKNHTTPPHILVMTATPIPRTLAMTLYSQLALSVINEMPPNRKPVKTYHAYDRHRLRVFNFIRKEISKGRQVYIVYPRIEEAQGNEHTKRYKDLMDGYESVCRAFPKIPISILHGRMPSSAKQYEMDRFVRAETKIMVATTVIEVGVNVPNATVMVIENAESFGLSQLHQLRGRVIRGVEQSYCILMTKDRLSSSGKARIQTMVEHNDGFDIAHIDLRLRGPGQLAGLEQSGVSPFKLVNFSEDEMIIEAASQAVKKLLQTDPTLSHPQNKSTRDYLDHLKRTKKDWSQIS